EEIIRGLELDRIGGLRDHPPVVPVITHVVIAVHQRLRVPNPHRLGQRVRKGRQVAREVRGRVRLDASVGEPGRLCCRGRRDDQQEGNRKKRLPPQEGLPPQQQGSHLFKISIR